MAAPACHTAIMKSLPDNADVPIITHATANAGRSAYTGKRSPRTAPVNELASTIISILILFDRILV